MNGNRNELGNGNGNGNGNGPVMDTNAVRRLAHLQCEQRRRE